MALHEEHDEQFFRDENLGDDYQGSEEDNKKRVKRLLEEHLENKRLRDECKDGYDELIGEFDWDE